LEAAFKRITAVWRPAADKEPRALVRISRETQDILQSRSNCIRCHPIGMSHQETQIGSCHLIDALNVDSA
jgi:hypothetical protein